MASKKDKIALEVELLRLAVEEAKRPFWRKKEFIGFQGSVLVSVLGVLISSVLAFWTSADKIADEAARKQVSEAVADLDSSESHRRDNAAQRLKRLDSRYNFKQLRGAYKNSITAESAEIERGRQPRTPWLRVGAVEAAGSLHGWEHSQSDLGNLLRDAMLSDRSPLVRHQAAVGLVHLFRPDIPLDVASLYKREASIARNTRTEPKSRAEMVLVPAGIYVIGRHEGSIGGVPLREVQLPAYWIDRTSVTNEEWQRVVGDRPTYLESRMSGARRDAEIRKRRENPKLPVIGVSYKDATDFCKATGRELPTESQWEVAGRGSTGWIYPWGMDPRVAESRLAVEKKAKKAVHDVPDRRRDAIRELTRADAADVSVFGVRGLVTGVREWTGSPPELTVDEANGFLKATGSCIDRCVVKGASGWEADIYDTIGRMHLARRMTAAVGTSDNFHAELTVGFRCVSNRPTGA